VESLGDDIGILYKDAPPLLVNQYSWPESGPENTPLVNSALASDPRVYLDPSVHPDGQFDPLQKTAVLFFPFTKPSWQPYPATHTSLTSTDAIDSVEKTLTKKGYTISPLLDKNATLASKIHRASRC
jgi:hypothetical protein